MGNKFILIILAFIFTNICYCQLIDESVKKYEYDIFLQLRQKDSLIFLKKDFKDAQNYIFASEIIKFNEDIIFYKVGVTANHSYKYIGYTMNNNQFLLLPTKDFYSEFKDIIDVLMVATENSNIDSTKIIHFLEIIYSVYIYNRNPPWKARGYKSEINPIPQESFIGE